MEMAVVKPPNPTLSTIATATSTQESHYGDTGTTADDRTVIRTFAPNTTKWILGLPTSETVYEGLGTGHQVARTDFYYDGTTSCGVPSSNQQPTLGNVTRIVHWLKDGTNPETRLAYDAFGNVRCARDANGHTTTMTYDPANTFVRRVTNHLGQVTTTQYYGVDGVTMDAGLYGQVHTVTDPNGAVVTTTYDVFGRPTAVTHPDGFWTKTNYIQFGTLGSQHVRTNSSLGYWTWTFFDAFGRTRIAYTTGPDGKLVRTVTFYDRRGLILGQSLPSFSGDPLQWILPRYDPLGRLLSETHPDGSTQRRCYDDWVTVTIDANQHRTRTVRDAFGRVLRVQEYEGTFANCRTDEGSPYATTTYGYDVLGNLTGVTDAKGNVLTLAYDTLSRTTRVDDPDMGAWTYRYDANGHLIEQTDAKNQSIYYQYDALNRRVQKDYRTQKTLEAGDVVYTYDGHTDNRQGRLSQVQDVSGTMTYSYDAMGRVTRTDQVVDGVTYTTQRVYDGSGRLTTLTYPDHSVVTHTYNGPQLKEVTGGNEVYARFEGYNAQGQPGTLTHANGVTTTYTYDPQNFRLKTLTSLKGAAEIQALGYGYDAVGNVNVLTDAQHGQQIFGYDVFNRLMTATGSYGTLTYSYNEIGNMVSNSQVGAYTYPASGANSVRPHAVTSAGAHHYTYDANGNLLAGANRSLIYDAENRPTRITVSGESPTTLVYDREGGRVKKTVDGQTTVYIGKHYVCQGTTCAKMIFANGQRVAMVQVNSGATSYFHSDHLGSTSVVTDANGTVEQDVAYFPYGSTRNNTGTADVAYKYTGKEQDASTGLYFYEARYYDPVLGRFISPDPLVPDPGTPQDFNRYAYVRNNPLRYVDPNGAWAVQVINGAYGFFSGVTAAYLAAQAQGATEATAYAASISGGFVGLGVGIFFPQLAAQVGVTSGQVVAMAIGGVSNFLGQYAGNQAEAVGQNLARGFAPFHDFSLATGLEEINIGSLGVATAAGPLVTLSSAKFGAAVASRTSSLFGLGERSGLANGIETFFGGLAAEFGGTAASALGAALPIPTFDLSSFPFSIRDSRSFGPPPPIFGTSATSLGSFSIPSFDLANSLSGSPGIGIGGGALGLAPFDPTFDSRLDAFLHLQCGAQLIWNDSGC